MRKILCSSAVLILMWSGVAVAQKPAESSIEAKLRFAATQHEIISILIKEGQFDRVLPEFVRILELGFVGPDEELVVKETWSIVSSLTGAKQYDLAHMVADEALKQTAQVNSRFTLLMLKGKLYKHEGRLSEALSTYRKAQQIQQ